ncbi:MAG: tetratricopeptide repeat protein [Bacteroidales bacterium]|nr:tetratricopeptide repeat protein [Bacteroidales bacterium]
MKKVALHIFMFVVYACAWAQQTEADTASWQQLLAEGRHYREQGNSFRALQLFQQADSLHSNDTLQREIADCLYVRGQYNKCIELCKALLTPDSLAQDLYLMARCYDKMEMPMEATHYQMLVAERDIENYNNLLSLCKTLIDGEQYNDALALIDRYCAIDSTNAAVNTVKAYAFHKAGRWTEAIDLYEQLVADGDNRASTLYYLGLSYYRRKNYGEAYDLLKRAVERSERNNTNILSRFGIAELAIKRSEITWVQNHRPVSDSTSILNEFNSNTSPDDYLAEYQRMDSICESINQQGIEDIQEAIGKMYPDPETLYYLHYSIANHYFWKSNDKMAIKFFRQCLDDSPNHANVYFNMALSYHKLNDYRNEMKYYQLFLDKAKPDEDPNAIQMAKEAIEECRKVLFMKSPAQE